MASTRTEREQDVADGDAPAAWDQRPIFGESAGLPWWAAILFALVVSAIGAAVDVQLSEKPPTIIFQATYLVACVVAVCWVRRRNLFGPMVQPPLVLAIVLIALNIVDSGWPKEFNLKEFLLSYGIPVINSFPTMAVVTGVTLAIGLFRLFWQRDPERGSKDGKPEPAAKQPPKERKPRPLDDEPPTRAARPVTPPAGRTALRADRSPARRPRATESATGARAAADPPARGRITDDSALRGRTAEAGGRRRRGEGTAASPAASPPPRRGAAANRARPLEDSAPHQRDSAPRRRPNETLAPRPKPPSRRQPPPQRPWEADQASPPERRRAQPPSAGQRKPPRSERPERPEPSDASDLRRRISGRRPPPPPRSRRWDSDDRG